MEHFSGQAEGNSMTGLSIEYKVSLARKILIMSADAWERIL